MSLLTPKEIFLNKLGLVDVLKLPKGNFEALSFDNKFFASYQNDEGIISIWDFKKRKKNQEVEVPSKSDILDCFLSPDNKFLVATDNSQLYLLEIQSGQISVIVEEKELFHENNYYVRITPNNQFIACGGDDIILRDIKSGEILWKQDNPGGTASDLIISKDGNYIISTAGDIYIWNAITGSLIREIGYKKHLGDLEAPEMVRIAISDDNEVIASTTDGGLCLWTFSGELLFDNLSLYKKKTSNENYNRFNADHFVAISPDKKYIASNAFDEKSIHIMELTNGNIVNVLNHDFDIYNIIFLKNMNYLLSADFNGNIYIWDYLSGHFKSRRNEIDDIEKLKIYIDQGEGQQIEFKASLRWDVNIKALNRTLEHIIVKTISGFLNSNGGILLIGISDDGKILGLKKDYKTLKKKDRDGFSLKLVEVITNYIKEKFCTFWKTKFIKFEDKEICMIIVNKSPEPCYTRSFDKKSEIFYLRVESSTRALKPSDMVSYINHRFKS